MSNLFLEMPMLNSPYVYLDRYWELDERGQPTQQVVECRRLAEFVTLIPKLGGEAQRQSLNYDDPDDLSTEAQRYEIARNNPLRQPVDEWCRLSRMKIAIAKVSSTKLITFVL